MNKNYAFMRFQKISTISVACERESYGLDRLALAHRTHPELMHLNRYVFAPEYHDCSNLSEAFNKATKDVKVRENAVRYIEFLFGVVRVDGIDIKDWANASGRWLEKKFGNKSLVSLRLEFDGELVRLYTYVIPLEEREGKVFLNARKYINGKVLLSALHDDYAKFMKDFGLSRSSSVLK